MSDVKLPGAAAATVLRAVIREQLAAAYYAGVDAAPHGMNALADPAAPSRFDAIMVAVDDYTVAIATAWRSPDQDQAERDRR